MERPLTRTSLDQRPLTRSSLDRERDFNEILSGALQKKNVFGHWKTRKFILNSKGELKYSSAENLNQFRTIELKGCMVQQADAISNRPFSIGIFSSNLKTPLLILAKDSVEQKQWLDGLKEFCTVDTTHEMPLIETLEGIGDGVVVANEKGDILSLNKAARAMFDYSPADIIGKNVRLLMPDPYRDLHDSFIRRHLATGENHLIGRSRRVTAQRSDGSTFPVQINLGEVYTSKGVRFIATLREMEEVETYKTKIVLEDSRKIVEERMESLKTTLDFELNVLKDRIMELEQDKKKFKSKSLDLFAQLQRENLWKGEAEKRLTKDQKDKIGKALNQVDQLNTTLDTSLKITTQSPETQNNSQPIEFLDRSQFKALWEWVPTKYQQHQLVPLFSAEQHGRSLNTFYSKLADYEPTILVIKTTRNQLIGAYCSLAWRRSNQYYGNGECFLFRLTPSCKKYGWMPGQPPYFVMGTDDEVIVGGGLSGYGLRFNMQIGWSQHCDTFYNEPLTDSKTEPFNVAELKVFRFEAKKPSPPEKRAQETVAPRKESPSMVAPRKDSLSISPPLKESPPSPNKNFFGFMPGSPRKYS